jgi:GNAT superfamily N-acetyltransferase
VRVRYRPATAGDAEAIATLHADSWRLNYRGAFSDAFLDGEVFNDRRAVWQQRLARDRTPCRTIVAEDDAVVVGFAHTVFDDHPIWGALLDNLHVVHGLQRHGVGKNLMSHTAQAVLAHTPSAGLYLWVLEQNTTAQAFYEALHGVRVERGIGEPPGGGTTGRFRYAWSDPSVLVVPGPARG